jgi:hydrogenase maturation protein HypF
VGHLATVASADLHLWADMIARGINSPRACGLGRLFDAVSVLVSACADSTYEGQAAVELEAAAGIMPDDAPPYEFAIHEAPGPPGKEVAAPGEEGWVIDTAPVIRGVVEDIEAGRGAARTSARFHTTVAAMLLAAAEKAFEQTHLNRICLAGGCFANDRLVRTLAPALERDGFEVYVHREVSPGDGGVALGQAYSAAARLRGGAM